MTNLFSEKLWQVDPLFKASLLFKKKSNSKYLTGLTIFVLNKLINI